MEESVELNVPLLKPGYSEFDNPDQYESYGVPQSETRALSTGDSLESYFDTNRYEDYSQVDNAKICKSYFYGQISNVMKSAVWWSMIGVLVTNFTDSHYGLSVTRCAFNLALILGSFVANLVAEVVNIRKLLCFTTLFRMVIWSIVIPVSYTLLRIYKKMSNFWTLFVTLMLLDGFQVSLSNTVDLDYEGIDRISHQYDILVPDTLHQHMNNVYQLVFDFSFIFLSIPLSLVIYLLVRVTNLGENYILIGMFDVVFFVLSVVSLFFYIFGMPVIKSSQYLAYSRNLSLSAFSLLSEFFTKLRDNKDGFKIMCMRPYLLRNLLYFSFETAFENSVYLLIIPQLGYHNKWFSDLGSTGVNLFSVCLISLSKLGTSIYGIYITYKIKNNLDNNLYRSKPITIIKCLLFSAFSMMLLPLSLTLDRYVNSFKWLSLFLVALGLFLFFTFTTLPKITYSSILQYNISNHPLSYKLFDFVGTFITLVDALVVFLISFLLKFPGNSVTFEKIILYTSVLYISYSLIQVLTELIRPSSL